MLFLLRSATFSNICLLTLPMYCIVLKIVLTYCKKKMFYWLRKTFENASQKVENLQTCWDHENNSFQQLKMRTIFGTDYFSNLLMEVCTYNIGAIKIRTGKIGMYKQTCCTLAFYICTLKFQWLNWNLNLLMESRASGQNLLQRKSQIREQMSFMYLHSNF